MNTLASSFRIAPRRGSIRNLYEANKAGIFEVIGDS